MTVGTPRPAGSTGRDPAAPPLRADAARNRRAIIEAAVSELRSAPDASVARIAAAAGVGRVTLYGHFATRAELIDAALVEVLDRGNAALERVDLTGDPRAALSELVDSSWSLISEARSLLRAANQELPPARVRDAHDVAERRVRRLLLRGRREGVFRTDLPTAWLLTTMHAVMHGAAEELLAGRLRERDAAPYIRATLLGAFAPPPSRSSGADPVARPRIEGARAPGIAGTDEGVSRP